jgi:hypothetical protein
MDLFTWTPSGKLNEVDVEYSATRNVRNGPETISGSLGDIIKCDTKFATERTKSGGATLYQGEYMLVRTKDNSTASIIAGRPVFWGSEADLDACIVTPDAAADALFAGVAINAPSVKGNCILIVVAGDVDGLVKNPITDAGDADLGDFYTLDISGGVATFDVLANATAVTWGSLKSIVAKRIELPTAGQLARMQLTPAAVIRRFREGVR